MGRALTTQISITHTKARHDLMHATATLATVRAETGELLGSLSTSLAPGSERDPALVEGYTLSFSGFYMCTQACILTRMHIYPRPNIHTKLSRSLHQISVQISLVVS